MKPGTRLEQKSVCSDQVTIVKKLSCSLLRIGRALFALSGLIRLSVEKASEVKNKMGFALKAGKLRRNLIMSHFLIRLCTLGGTLAPLLKAGVLKKVFTFIQECPVELLPNIARSSNQMNNLHLKNKIIAFIRKLKRLDGGILHNKNNSHRYLSFMAGALLGLYHSKEQSAWELKHYLRECKDEEMNLVRNEASLYGFDEPYYNLGLLFGLVVGNPYVILVYKAQDRLSKDLVLWSGKDEYSGFCIAIPVEMLALFDQLKDFFEKANSGDFSVTVNSLIQYLKSRCDFRRNVNKQREDNNKPDSSIMLELLTSQFEKLSRGESLQGTSAEFPRF